MNPFLVRPVKRPVTALSAIEEEEPVSLINIKESPGEDQDVVSATGRPPWVEEETEDDDDTMPCARHDALEYDVAANARRRGLEERHAAELRLKRMDKERARRAHTPSPDFVQFLKNYPAQEQPAKADEHQQSAKAYAVFCEKHPESNATNQNADEASMPVYKFRTPT